MLWNQTVNSSWQQNCGYIGTFVAFQSVLSMLSLDYYDLQTNCNLSKGTSLVLVNIIVLSISKLFPAGKSFGISYRIFGQIYGVLNVD